MIRYTKVISTVYVSDITHPSLSSVVRIQVILLILESYVQLPKRKIVAPIFL